MQKQEEVMKKQIKKLEASKEKYVKRVDQYKKYIQKVEDSIIQKDEQLKFLEMFKKNSEISSQVESSVSRAY